MAATVRMTQDQIKTSGRGRVDMGIVDTTTEADIQRHMIEDGEEIEGPMPDYQPAPNIQAIRERLGLSQALFARTIGVPVATIRNWEQRRTGIAPAARTLLRILEREPDAALRALAGSAD